MKDRKKMRLWLIAPFVLLSSVASCSSCLDDEQQQRKADPPVDPLADASQGHRPAVISVRALLAEAASD